MVLDLCDDGGRLSRKSFNNSLRMARGFRFDNYKGNGKTLGVPLREKVRLVCASFPLVKRLTLDYP